MFFAVAPGRADPPADEWLLPLNSDHMHGWTRVELPSGERRAGWFQGSGERQANGVGIRSARIAIGDSVWSKSFSLADVPNFSGGFQPAAQSASREHVL